MEKVDELSILTYVSMVFKRMNKKASGECLTTDTRNALHNIHLFKALHGSQRITLKLEPHGMTQRLMVQVKELSIYTTNINIA